MNEQLISDYLSGMSYNSLCKKYHHKFATIKKILKENNIDTSLRDRKKYITNKYFSIKEIERMVDDYNKGFSLNKISTKYQISVQKVKNILKDNGVKIRPFSNKKYYLNENYFDTLTKNGAYILGFFAADGWVKKKDNMIELTLSSVDAEILEKMKEELSLTREIKYFEDSKGFQKASLIFSSQKIKRIFEFYGVVPNKTFTLKRLPNLSKELMPHYIRGYADGDGSVGSTKKNWQMCSVNKTFLEDIINFLYNEYNIEKVSIYEDKRREHILYSFCYSKADSLKKIYKEIYDNNCLHLSRKYGKILKIYNDITSHETLLH